MYLCLCELMQKYDIERGLGFWFPTLKSCNHCIFMIYKVFQSRNTNELILNVIFDFSHYMVSPPSLEHVPEGVLTDARTTLCALILSVSYLTGSHRRNSPNVAYFSTFHYNFSKKIYIFSNKLILFH